MIKVGLALGSGGRAGKIGITNHFAGCTISQDELFDIISTYFSSLQKQYCNQVYFFSRYSYSLFYSSIQVPWTKLGFEPVVITINTMECVLSLRKSDSKSDDGSCSVDSSKSSASSMGTKRSKKKLQDSDAPPGYIQSLLNRSVFTFGVRSQYLFLRQGHPIHFIHCY